MAAGLSPAYRDCGTSSFQKRMSRRLTPPIHLLRAFVTTAQLGTVSAASAALHLTQSAVSKQVQELEEWVGMPLFARVRRRLQVTPAGQRYQAAVAPLLDQLQAVTIELVTSPAAGWTLNVSSLPSFGAKWLMPRLPAFNAAHKKILLNFVPYLQGYDFSRSDLDCAIRYGDGRWPGAVAEYMMGREMTLIAPSREKLTAPLRSPGDITQHTLLHHATVPSAWPAWCEKHGVKRSNPHGDLRLDQYHVIVRAVSAGMGLALVPTCLVIDELHSGEVEAPLAEGFQADAGYFLCYPEAKADLEPLVVFRDWLREEAQRAVSEPPARKRVGR
jgi:LysR family glycine cleavage system transcriptional activator